LRVTRSSGTTDEGFQVFQRFQNQSQQNSK
jgi:hypothetical protein